MRKGGYFVVLAVTLIVYFVFHFSFFNVNWRSILGEILTLTVSVREVGLSQNSFRFYVPKDSLTPIDSWPPGDFSIGENENISEFSFPPFTGSVLRLRISIKNNDILLPALNRKFKLQFAKLTTSSCSTLPGSAWIDLGDPGSGALWRGLDFFTLIDGSSLSSTLLTGSNVKGTYQEKNPTPLNPLLNQNDIVEYDWVIQNNIQSLDNSTYCFRMVNNNGIVFQNYIRYPKITIPLPPKATTSDFIDITTGGQTTLTNPDGSKFMLDVPPNYLPASSSFDLTAFDFSTYLNQIGSQPAGKFGANQYIYRFEVQINNIASDSFLQPITLKIKYNSSDITSINEDSLKIYKFNGTSWQSQSTTLDKTNKIAYTSIFSGSSYGLFGDSAPTSTSTPSGSSGGGGGGGGGGGSSQTVGSNAKLVLKGKAYPQATVNLLLDSQLVSTVNADSDGNFEFSASNLGGGGYNIGIWARDTLNLKSSTYSFYLGIRPDTTNNVFSILLPPTISINKSILKEGDSIKILGSSAPDSYVIIEVRSDPRIYTVSSQKKGIYSQSVSAKDLGKGQHSVKSKTKISLGSESIFSDSLFFGVGVAPKKIRNTTGDLNNDGKVNIIDFSVLAFWYKRLNFPSNFDLNKDGKIDLRDFSILAFYWSG